MLENQGFENFTKCRKKGRGILIMCSNILTLGLIHHSPG